MQRVASYRDSYKKRVWCADESEVSIVSDDEPVPKRIEPHRIHLHYGPGNVQRLTIDGWCSFPRVKIVRAAPLSRPDRYISVLNEDGEEVCWIDDPSELDEQSQAVIKRELEQRYLVATILRVNSLQFDMGTAYWDVDTDRGRREFVVPSVREQVQWLNDRRLLIIDVDGNRFEIPDINALDRRSRKLIASIL